MNLFIQPNRWSCLPTAFGMILDLEPREMFEEIGHDGSEILWPNQEEPFRRRSFHIQEIIPLCIERIVYPVEIEHQPVLGLAEEAEVEVYDNPFLKHALETRPGVILCKHKGKRHAVAWDHKESKVFDPAGYKATIQEYEVLSFYACY